MVQQNSENLIWVGLTGGLGTGKSTVAELLRSKGFSVADADQLAKEAVSPGSQGLQKLVERYGEKILNARQELDRKALADVVFQHPSERQFVESVIHPFVQKSVGELKDQWQRQGQKLAFYDVPLLFEKNLNPQFDAVVVVSAPMELQIPRLKQRTGWSEAEIKMRMESQLPLELKVKAADFVLENSATKKDLSLKIDELISKLRNWKRKTETSKEP
ncbi:MAG: dephospho-CoA kinase [Proteobacteria bacterium]|nr:dephospho-CoA kinase [Pseudomonadota bacterium]